MPLVGGTEYTIHAVFEPLLPLPGFPLPPSFENAAIVVVLPSVGGTTNVAPGTYALPDATDFNLRATANSDWQFSHWAISGDITNHGSSPLNLTPTDNPYNVNHGYGSTYYYQAVFTPVGGSATPTPSPTPSTNAPIGGFSNETWIIIGLVVVIIVILIGFGAYTARLKKHP
jgi:hypothetical protein